MVGSLCTELLFIKFEASSSTFRVLLDLPLLESIIIPLIHPLYHIQVDPP